MKNPNNRDFEKLISELSIKYLIEEYEVKAIINNSLSEVYQLEGVSLDLKKGTLLGINKEKPTDSFDLKYFNISNKKYNAFLKLLNNKLFELSSDRLSDKFKNLLAKSNNILYGRVEEVKDNRVKLSLYNRRNNKINNFILFLKVSEFFDNEILNRNYANLGKGFLLHVSERIKPKHKNGFFHITGTRKHPEIVRYYINNIFGKIKENLGKSYGYEKCIIDIKNKKITLILNLYFSNTVKKYFEEQLEELDKFKIIYINSKKGLTDE